MKKTILSILMMTLMVGCGSGGSDEGVLREDVPNTQTPLPPPGSPPPPNTPPPAPTPGKVNLAWGAVVIPPNAENIALGGYKIYWGLKTGEYTHVKDVGITTNASITGLDSGRFYYFAATAYSITNLGSPLKLESPFSNEVGTTAP